MKKLLGVLVVRVPRLAGHKNLHKPHAPLDQPAGQQALAAEDLRGRVVEPVERPGCRALTAQVHQVGHRRLHAEGQLVVGDGRLDGVAAQPFGHAPVQLAEQVEERRPDTRQGR